jgi:hypothetical protein
LYDYAIKIHGGDAIFHQLASAINAKGAAGKVLLDFHISEGQLKRWLRDMKGKQLRSYKSPYLTDDQIAAHE